MRELVFALFPFVITVLASPSGLKKTNLRQMDENLTWDKITWPWILDLDEACTKMPKPDKPCSGSWNGNHQSFEICCGRTRLKLLRPFNYGQKEKSFFTTRANWIKTWEDARKDCQTQGGDIATMTMEEQKHLIQILEPGYWYRVGAKKIEKNGNIWKWVHDVNDSSTFSCDEPYIWEDSFKYDWESKDDVCKGKREAEIKCLGLRKDKPVRKNGKKRKVGFVNMSCTYYSDAYSVLCEKWTTVS